MPMKIASLVAALVLGGFAVAEASPTPAEADRLHAAAGVLNAMRGSPDSIPQDIWNKAACVIVVPSLKKAAFGIGGEYGKGVVTCRRAAGWTAPAFMRLEKGSWGFQIGAEEVDLVLLVMNHEGMNKLLQDKVSLGAGASVAAGPVGRAAAASTDAQMSAEILTYSRSHGVFAGIDLSGGVLGPDTDANRNLYGDSVTPRAILVTASVRPPAQAEPFLMAVRNEFNPVATTGRER
ncbi:MAG: lipid-binding SYLF domain-containing protein [Vicinamibacterales bacterium]